MVEISFYLLSIVALSMLLILFRRTMAPSGHMKKFLVVPIWLIYIVVIERIGLLQDFSLPPRIPMLVVMPAIIIILILVNGKSNRTAFVDVPIFFPVALQSFRVLVELLIYATYKQGIYPELATFKGLNFDIFVGLSAIVVAFAIFKNKIGYRGILIWNIASMCVLLVTVYSFIYSYYFTDFSTSDKGHQFVELPYLLLPAVLLPVAIFLHVFSIKQVLFKRYS